MVEIAPRSSLQVRLDDGYVRHRQGGDRIRTAQGQSPRSLDSCLNPTTNDYRAIAKVMELRGGLMTAIAANEAEPEDTRASRHKWLQNFRSRAWASIVVFGTLLGICVGIWQIWPR